MDYFIVTNNKVVKLLYTFLFGLTLQLTTAQEQDVSLADNILETKEVEIQPEFPGGMEVLYNFISKNFKKPEIPSLIGKVFLSFIVETDGSLSDIQIIKDVGFGTGKEAQRIMETSPRWLPGKQAGKLVRVRYLLALPVQTE